MKYAHLYTGPDGLAYFEDIDVPQKDNGAGQHLSDAFPASSMVMRRNTREYDVDFHVARRPTFILTLSGKVEIIASGGEKREFGPGDIMFADDTTGKGHTSKGLTDERISVFVYPV